MEEIIILREGDSMPGTIIPFGYLAPGALQRLDTLMASGEKVALVDIRYSARSRRPEWNSERLRERYGRRYKPLSMLGNKNYKGGPIEIADPERGIPLLVEALKRGMTLILLCACQDYGQCHRKVVAEMVKEAYPDVEVCLEERRGMKALSIQQPWCWLIAHGLKDIENRDWSTSYRGPVLLHAGKRIDSACFDGHGLFAAALCRASTSPDMLASIPLRKQDYEVGGIVGVATLVDVVTSSDSPWFRGAYGFVFQDARPLPFMALRGKLGLFSVPDTLLPRDLLEVK